MPTGRVEQRGGELKRWDLMDDAAVAAPTNADDLLCLDAALTNLAAEDPRLAKLVEPRYFTGLTIVEAAKVLGGVQQQLVHL